MKKHFKWLLGLVAGLLSAGSLSAADYNIVTYGAKEGGRGAQYRRHTAAD